MEQHQNMNAHNAMQAFNQMQQINQQALSTLSSQFGMTTTPFRPTNIQSTPMFAAGPFDQTSSGLSNMVNMNSATPNQQLLMSLQQLSSGFNPNYPTSMDINGGGGGGGTSLPFDYQQLIYQPTPYNPAAWPAVAAAAAIGQGGANTGQMFPMPAGSSLVHQSPTLARAAVPSPGLGHQIIGQHHGSFAPNAVDTLEEVLATFTNDYNVQLGNDDMSLIDQDQILREAMYPPTINGHQLDKHHQSQLAVGGGGGQAPMHSIFDYDAPTTSGVAGGDTLQPHTMFATNQTNIQKQQPVADVHTVTKARRRKSSPKRPSPVAPPPRVVDTGDLPQPVPLTPKVREKIKQRRDRELAEIDRAFDRHLTLVAERNARAVDHFKKLTLPQLPPLTAVTDDTGVSALLSTPVHKSHNDTNNFNDLLLDKHLPSTSKIDVNLTARFSPVHFSPAASPHGEHVADDVKYAPNISTTMAVAASLFAPTTRPTGAHKVSSSSKGDDLRVFIPDTSSSAGGSMVQQEKAARIPIWKRASMSSFAKDADMSFLDTDMDMKPNISTTISRSSSNIKKPAADAYEFDDFDADNALTTPKSFKSPTLASPVGAVYDENIEAEVARKLREISSLHPEMKQKTAAECLALYDLKPASSVRGGVETASGSAGKRGRGRPRVRKSGNSNTCAIEPISSAAQALLDLRAARAAFVQKNVYMRSRPIVDDTATACAVTLVGGGGDGGGGQGHQPKVVIRIPKLLIKRTNVAEQQPQQDQNHRKHGKHSNRHRRDQSVGDDDVLATKRHRPANVDSEDPDYLPAGTKRVAKDSTRESCGDSVASDDDNFEMINPPSMAATSDAATSGDPTKPTPTESALTQQPFNPKKRLMQWVVSQSSTDNNGVNTTKNGSDDMGVKQAAGEHEQTNGDTAGRALVVDNDFTNTHRLAQFFQPFTTLHKGQFVVSKSDVGTAECAVWKVDNQNLLQKYAPEPDEQNPSRIVYRNSSTYAGWCEQNTCRYMVVNVRVQKQTRTECVVVPDYALTDLLPAVSLTESEQLALALTSAIFQTPSAQMPTPLSTAADADNMEMLQSTAVDMLRTTTEPPATTTTNATNADQPLCDALETYLHALLLHNMTGTFLATIRANHDWKFMRHISDVDKLNEQTLARLLADSRWRVDYQTQIEAYTQCAVVECAPQLTAHVRAHVTRECQACAGDDNQSLTHLVHLYCSQTAYDFETLQLVATKSSSTDSPIPALEFAVCSRCSHLTRLYHSVFHMRYRMYMRCEVQIDGVRARLNTNDPTAILQQCLTDKTWMNEVRARGVRLRTRVQIINDNLAVWRKISEELNSIRYT